MACDVTNLSKTEILNFVKNKRNIYQKKSNQSQTDTLSNLEHTTNTFGQVEIGEVDKTGKPIKKYGFIDGAAVFTGRVTDAVNKKFIQAVGKKRADEINLIPDNQTKAEVGSFIHLIAENIVKALVNEKDLGTLKKEFMSSKYPHKLTEAQFDSLSNGIKDILGQINEQQAKINKRLGTDGKVEIITEQIVVDSTKDLAGSIDLLAVYSDNTASIFDFKSMMPASRYKKGTKIVEEFIPFYKIESFKLQQHQYKRILQDIYGIKKVRQTRIVPIQMELKKKAGGKEGRLYTNQLSKIAMGENQDEFLSQVTLGFEDTGYAGINELISKNLETIKKLKEKQNQKGLRKGEWQYLQKSIDSLQKANNSIILKGDFRDFYSHIVTAERTFMARRYEEEFNEDGSANPNYLSNDEIKDIISEFTVYTQNLKYTLGYLKELGRAEDKTEYERLNKLVTNGQGYIQRVKVEAEEMLNARGLDNVEDKYKDEYGRLIPTKEEGFFTKLFGNLSEYTHPIFKQFRKLKDTALNKKRIDLKKTIAELESKQMALFSWAKSKGMTKQQAYDMLINKKTGNLVSKLSEEYWEKFNLAKENKDLLWMKKHYEIRDMESYIKRYNEKLEAKKEALRIQYHNLEDWIQDGEVIHSAKYHKKMYDMALKTWIRENNLLESKDAWFNPKMRYELNMKKEMQDKYVSAEYSNIEKHKPLKEFYDMYVKKNKEFREALGLKYGKLPNNFIPNVRKELVEKLTDPSNNAKLNVANSINEMMDSLSVREEDVYLKARDPETGEVVKNIPMLYVNKFKDADGNNISHLEKSYDLGKSLVLFADMAYNYKYMSEIEGSVYALQQTLANSQQILTTASGTEMKDSAFNRVLTNVKPDTEINKIFNKFVDYYLYGVKYSEKDTTFEMMGKTISTKKTVLAAKNYFSMKSLGLAFLPGAAAYLHGRTGLYLEAVKGIAFTKKQKLETFTDHFKEKEKWEALAHYFEPHTEDLSYRESLAKSGSKLIKYVNSRTLFSPLRKADENIDNFLTVAMSKNYGVDENGNIKRLENLPEGSKSIWESTTYDKKTGKIKVEGLTESAFIGFRNAVKTTSIKIKGAMSSDDINQIELNMAANVMMQFKTWMPGILKERFGSLKYNEMIDSVDYGRYRAYMSEYDYVTGQGFLNWMGTTVMPNIAKLSIDLATFGFMPENILKPVNEERARAHYEKWASENPTEAQDISYEQFLKVKKAQMRTLMNELRIVLGIMGMVAALSAAADGVDEDDNGIIAWILRLFKKLFNKTESELSFAMNPEEFMRLAKNPIPMTRMLVDVYKTIGNTLDETRDLVVGENSPQDKTSWGHFSSQWIIGVGQLRRIFDMIFEEDKRRKY
jgi:hypothetical protein